MSTVLVDREELRELVADALDVEVEQVTDDAKYVEELGVDSLMGLEIMVQLEKEFGIRISEDEFKELTTFGQTYELIARKTA